MIKCPKGFWKIMQENKEWNNIIEELEQCGLNMEIEENNKKLMVPNHLWDDNFYTVPNCTRVENSIKIYNLKYKETYFRADRYELDNKKRYEEELKFIKNEMCDITSMKAEKSIKSFKTREEKEIIDEYTERIESLVKSVKKYEEFLNERYDEYVKFNSGFETNVINGIREKIKEYNSIKFGTADIVLY